jgi:hypothetical protein
MFAVLFPFAHLWEVYSKVVEVLLKVFVCALAHHNILQVYKCSMITLHFSFIRFSAFSLEYIVVHKTSFMSTIDI